MDPKTDTSTNRRILIVDDNPAIHEDFRKVLAKPRGSARIDELESSLFGEVTPDEGASFDLVDAAQGDEALELARHALKNDAPFAVAFVDIRMPPGIDGVETALRLWEVDPRLQVVICSAYSDYSWDQMRDKLGVRQQLLILKKPFDPVEVLQLAHALTEKWSLLVASQRTMHELEAAVASRTSALEATHQRLLETESRLRHAQKLEALGRLAGGIAHEINNPLAFITSNLAFISEVVAELEAPVPISSDLNQATREAQAGADRIRRIVRDVKIFSQAEGAPIGQVDLAKVVRRALELVKPEMEGRSPVLVELGGVGEVLAIEEGLVQVLYNLLTNAAAALPPAPGGSTTIALTASLDGPGRVAIEVRDTGSGIRPEDLPRIFDPFFSTKEVGSGTGLGLCICHGIVTKLGGEISVRSTVGSGSTFRVVLPAPTERPTNSRTTLAPAVVSSAA